MSAEELQGNLEEMFTYCKNGNCCNKSRSSNNSVSEFKENLEELLVLSVIASNFQISYIVLPIVKKLRMI